MSVSYKSKQELSDSVQWDHRVSCGILQGWFPAEPKIKRTSTNSEQLDNPHKDDFTTEVL